MKSWLVGLVLLLATATASAAEYKVEAGKQPPPDKLAKEISAQLQPTMFKVGDGKNVVAEIWVTKQWATKAGFEPSAEVIYPLEVGELIGALRFPKKGADFRGQEIPAGVYTLRYANQPVDGNHVGTFETRDFVLMLPATADQSPEPIAEMDLFKTSAESAESSHPAIMPLVKPAAGAAPAMRHLEEQEWWTLRLEGKGAKDSKIPLELVVVGKSAE